jgi:acyl-coenzyme A thioesterase PaaI-like protein
MIADHMHQNIAYARETGVEILSIGEGVSEVKLPLTDGVKNHINTAHAGAIFTVGETASGAAMSGMLGEDMFSVRPVAATAAIKYLKTGKTDLIAHGKTSLSKDEVMAMLDADGKAVFDVNVDIKDADGVTVSEMTVGWHLKKTG